MPERNLPERSSDAAAGDDSEALLLRCKALRHALKDHAGGGRGAEVDRLVRELGSALAALQDALLQEGRQAGAKSFAEDLESARDIDPLLRYFAGVPRAATSTALVQWQPGVHHFEFRVVDEARFRRFLAYFAPMRASEVTWRLLLRLYEVNDAAQLKERLAAGHAVSEARYEEAGVQTQFALDAWTLLEFDLVDDGETTTMPAPQQHLGEPIVPAVLAACDRAVQFYERKRGELLALAPSAATEHPARTTP